MEEKFGTPHPELEGFSEPASGTQWLVDGFFRLHRRRQVGESGYQAISYQEIVSFSRDVLALPRDLHKLFVRVIEETDNVILYDYHAKARSEIEALKAGKSK